MVKFQRTKFRAYAKLGKRQKNKQKYRKATGRHNKTREKIKSRPRRVEIGYKTNKIGRGLIEGKYPAVIMNVNGLLALEKNQIGIIGRVGNKKRLEIANVAEEKGIKILNLNTKNFIKRNEKRKEYKKKLEAEKNKTKKAEEKKETETIKDNKTETGEKK